MLNKQDIYYEKKGKIIMGMISPEYLKNLNKKRRREKMLKKKKKQIKNKKLNELGYPVNDAYGLFAAFRRAFNGDK